MLIHHRGHELPVYDTDTPVAITKAQIKVAARTDAARFLRRVEATCPDEHNLERILALADTALEAFTESTGIRSVNPAWGLYRTGRSTMPRAYHSAVPAGFMLVADVERVTPLVQPTFADDATLNTKVTQYKDAIPVGDYHLWDLGPDQFVMQDTEQGPVERLVDIEPRLRRMR